MIEAKNLRVGNLVLNDGCSCEVFHIYGGSFINCTLKTKQGSEINARYELLNPIPLSEDWLLKAGFEKDEDGVYKMKNVLYWIDRCYNSNTGVLQIASGYAAVINAPCQYVHELQNLYFCLFGEELTFKM